MTIRIPPVDLGNYADGHFRGPVEPGARDADLGSRLSPLETDGAARRAAQERERHLEGGRYADVVTGDPEKDF